MKEEKITIDGILLRCDITKLNKEGLRLRYKSSKKK